MIFLNTMERDQAKQTVGPYLRSISFDTPLNRQKSESYLPGCNEPRLNNTIFWHISYLSKHFQGDSIHSHFLNSLWKFQTTGAKNNHYRVSKKICKISKFSQYCQVKSVWPSAYGFLPYILSNSCVKLFTSF